jgi:hypothetical protein
MNDNGEYIGLQRARCDDCGLRMADCQCQPEPVAPPAGKADEELVDRGRTCECTGAEHEMKCPDRPQLFVLSLDCIGQSIFNNAFYAALERSPNVTHCAMFAMLSPELRSQLRDHCDPVPVYTNEQLFDLAIGGHLSFEPACHEGCGFCHDDGEECWKHPYRGPWTVAICLVDRAYGGPEEGGWWYDTGDPSDDHIQHLRGFSDKAAALKYRDELESSVCKEANVGRREISSVLSEGRYHAHLFEGMPRHWPDVRPHYE